METSLYPQNPIIEDRNFTKPEGSYRVQVIWVMVSILLFALMYIALIAGSLWLIYWAVMWPMTTVNKLTLFGKVGGIAAAGMFFAFIVKFLFKSHNWDDPANIEITEEEHPNLFAFIRKLSTDLKAPFPKKVFVNHEINAAVFYNSTVWSLILPVKKNLLIGLGLVNGVNLTEFKAILAHEFGHFSQSSMKLGSYIYMANRIIHSMVYDRDQWDNLLDQWKESDFRIAIFAWILMPIVWIVRQLLKLIYQGINLIYSGLSRQMEFHADRVAVSAAGSNAIVNGLYKLNSASEAFQFSNTQLSHAIDHNLYTDDLFYHQTSAFNHLKATNKEFEERLLENQHNEKGFLFDEDEVNHIAMYASHPANYLREKNAKKDFIEAVVDEKSPWCLFENPEALRQQVTKNLLNINFRTTEALTYTPAAEVEEFIQKELSETTYDQRYLGIYDDRFLSEVNLEAPAQAIADAGINTDNIAKQFEELYGEELEKKSNEIKQRHKDLGLVFGILTKQDRRKEFSIKGSNYTQADAQEVYENLIKEGEEDPKWHETFDKKVFAVHAFMAASLPDLKDTFYQQHRFHKEFQELFLSLRNVQTEVMTAVEEINQMGEIDGSTLRQFAIRFSDASTQLDRVYDKAKTMPMPDLQNLEAVERLSDFLLEKTPVQVKGTIFENVKVNLLIEEIGTMESRCRRLYFKSLGSILNTQEEIAKRYLGE